MWRRGEEAERPVPVSILKLPRIMISGRETNKTLWLKLFKIQILKKNRIIEQVR